MPTAPYAQRLDFIILANLRRERRTTLIWIGGRAVGIAATECPTKRIFRFRNDSEAVSRKPISGTDPDSSQMDRCYKILDCYVRLSVGRRQTGKKIASRPLFISPDPSQRIIEIIAVMMVFGARILREEGVIDAFRRGRSQVDVEDDAPDRGAGSE
jgi:hypothetical protein